jgi:hypothetical protein
MDRTDLRLARVLENLRCEKGLTESNPCLAYLSALLFEDDDRALEILHQHPEWNGKYRVRAGKTLNPGASETFRISLRFGRTQPVKAWLLGARASGRHVKHDYERLGSAHVAATHGHVELLKLLDSFDIDFSIARKQMGTPLRCAAQYGHLKAVDWLLGMGVEIDACIHPELGGTALAAAIENGHIQIVRLLVKRGAKGPSTNKLPNCYSTKSGRLWTMRQCTTHK